MFPELTLMTCRRELNFLLLVSEQGISGPCGQLGPPGCSSFRHLHKENVMVSTSGRIGHLSMQQCYNYHYSYYPFTITCTIILFIFFRLQWKNEISSVIYSWFRNFAVFWMLHFFSFRWIPGVWILCVDVSEHSVPSSQVV